MKFFLCIIFCFYYQFSWNQIKIEYEEKRNENEVPRSAVALLQKYLKKNTKIKWYYQVDAQKMVYEAKYHHNRQLYTS